MAGGFEETLVVDPNKLELNVEHMRENVATQVRGIAQTHIPLQHTETHAFSILIPMRNRGGREIPLIKHTMLGVPIPVNLGEVVNI